MDVSYSTSILDRINADEAQAALDATTKQALALAAQTKLEQIRATKRMLQQQQPQQPTPPINQSTTTPFVLTSNQLARRSYPTAEIILEVLAEGTTATTIELTTRVLNHGSYRKLRSVTGAGAFDLVRGRVTKAARTLAAEGVLSRVGKSSHNQLWLRPAKQTSAFAATV